jgi:RNA polymerase sigma-70 factor (sigma-E family)
VNRAQRDAEFHAFYVSENEALCRFGTFLTGDPDEGAELAQEAMARTYRTWSRVTSHPSAYARRILVNLVRSAYRRRLVARRYSQGSTAPTATVSQAPAVDDWLLVQDALNKLTPVRRATVVLRFYEDLTEAQIAEVLDRPLGTVKSDLHRAMKQLRPLLLGSVDEDPSSRALSGRVVE